MPNEKKPLESMNGHDNWLETFSSRASWLRTVVYARVANTHAVDEVMQEVALAAAKSNHAEIANKPGWLYRVAVRQALLFRRRQGRQTRRIAAYASQRAEEDDARSNPLSWLLAAEEAELVQDGLMQLPTRDRELLLLKYGEDWTAKEIGNQLGVNVNTVETRLHRARARLRQVLESRRTDDD